MKTFLLISAIGAAIYFAIYGPAPIDGIRSQIREAQVAQEREALIKAKEIAWQNAYRQSPKCALARTSLDHLQCKNDTDNQRRYFDVQWQAAIDRGWRPKQGNP